MSNKIPTTQYPVSEFITQRWSARSFSEKVIDEETVQHLFEAASWTASSMNEQPWKFIYAHRGTAGFNSLANCLMDGNKIWAKHGAVILLALAKKTFDNGSSNRHAMHDTGAANTTLLLEAAALDIFGHMMGGFHMQKTLDEFNIDAEHWEPACFIVLGYRDSPEKLDEPFKSRETTERSRKNISEFTEKL